MEMMVASLRSLCSGRWPLALGTGWLCTLVCGKMERCLPGNGKGMPSRAGAISCRVSFYLRSSGASPDCVLPHKSGDARSKRDETKETGAPQLHISGML